MTKYYYITKKGNDTYTINNMHKWVNNVMYEDWSKGDKVTSDKVILTEKEASYIRLKLESYTALKFLTTKFPQQLTKLLCSNAGESNIWNTIIEKASDLDLLDELTLFYVEKHLT